MNSLRLIVEALTSLINKKASTDELKKKANKDDVYTKDEIDQVALTGEYSDLKNPIVRSGSGKCSTEQGTGTVAASDDQHVQGRYNVPDSNNIYAHIVGNGFKFNNRYNEEKISYSNAHTVDWNGNGWFAGDIYVGGLNQNDSSAKMLSTIEYVNRPKNTIALNDAINGYTYIVSIRDGNLVTHCAAESIEVSVMPTKIEYMAGEYFNPDGMIVTAIAYDGTTREITDFTYTNKYLSEDATFVEICYTEADTTCIASIPVTVSAFDHSNVLVDFEYVDNGDGTYTITDWKGTLNGVASTEMIIPNYGCIIV